MVKNRKTPRYQHKPGHDRVKVGSDPESYLKKTPVWRFSDFDWDGPWGLSTCTDKIESMQEHIQSHLSSFETMTWQEILDASGGRSEGKGNNNHLIERDRLKKEAADRLDAKHITSDHIFSLRLNAGTRVYGILEGHCLRITFFDPHHKDRLKCAYDFDK